MFEIDAEIDESELYPAVARRLYSPRLLFDARGMRGQHLERAIAIDGRRKA